jgi:hypothetical protein
MGELRPVALSQRFTGYFDTDRRAFLCGAWQAIDQRVFAVRKAHRPPSAALMARSEHGILDLASRQPTRPQQPCRNDLALVDKNRAFFADSLFDQPLSQAGIPPI